MSDTTWPAIVAHRDRLIRIAARRCPTREDAEDVVHEAMLRCATFENLDESRLGQFLTTVTIRLCADVYRREDRTLRTAGRLGPEPGVVARGPEDVACDAADAVVLHGLLSRLPDRQRAVLVDRASGLSMRQICSRHSLTYKAAESALSRARGTMRSALASGFAVVAMAVTAFRPRRLLAIALPVAGAAVVGVVAVLRLPLAVVPPAASARVPAPALVPHRPAAAGPGARPGAAAAGAVATRTGNAARTVVRNPNAVTAPQPGPYHRDIAAVGDDKRVARTELYDQNPPESADQKAVRCARNGVWVNVGITPTLPPGELSHVNFDCNH
jgi:RNA polymerase sigma factor (sigma-70 family)